MKLSNPNSYRIISTSLALVLLTILPVTISAQAGQAKSTPNQKKAEGEPSLNETLDWIRQKLTTGAGFYSKEEKTRIKIYNVKVDDCSITYTEYFNSDGAGGDDVETSFHLRDADHTSLKVEEFLGGFVVKYNTLEAKQAINRNGRKVNKGFIAFQEQDMATRFAKALSHAIKLCAAKKEPF